MGRAWRIECEGGLYHVLSRGNERNDIFRDDRDRLTFLDVMGDMADRYHIDIFAYTLMNNHYHILLRTNDANLSKGMQWLALTYTRRFNNRYFRSGHLFQGRFKSLIVENDAYLLRLSCYIHRNPLRAGMITRLAQYPWSSYKVYAYGRKAPDWLITEPILSQLDAIDKHKAYREKAQEYADEEMKLWEDFRHGMIRGLDRQYYKAILLELIKVHGPVSRKDIDTLLMDKLPEILTEKQKRDRIHNLLAELSGPSGKVKNIGTRRYPKWVVPLLYKKTKK